MNIVNIVYPLNFLTSFFFLWTFIYAWVRNCNSLMIGCLIFLCTSVLYYGTNDPFVRKIDMIWCHLAVLYFMVSSASCSYLYLGAIVCFVICIKLYSNKPNTELNHSILHFIANIGIIFIIETTCNKKIETKQITKTKHHHWSDELLNEL